MPRTYTVQFSAVGVTAQQDFFELNAAAGKPLKILALYLSQSSDAGDAQEELLSILVKRGATTGGSGGTAPTPQPLNASDAAAGFTAEANNTTKANTGTIATLHSDGWNVRGPFAIVMPPEMQWEVPGGGRLTVELATTPADSITINGTIYVQELG